MTGCPQAVMKGNTTSAMLTINMGATQGVCANAAFKTTGSSEISNNVCLKLGHQNNNKIYILSSSSLTT
jgi:hypothetical protein